MIHYKNKYSGALGTCTKEQFDNLTKDPRFAGRYQIIKEDATEAAKPKEVEPFTPPEAVEKKTAKGK